MSNYSDYIDSLNPVAYWRMGEASGNLADSSGNANTAVLNGAATYGVAASAFVEGGVGDDAVSLNGNSANFWQAPNSASLDIADAFSVVAWIKRAAIGTFQSIISRPTNGYMMRIENGNVLSISKNFVAVIATSTIGITDTTGWHLVAMTKNGADVHLYIDEADVTGAVTNQTIVANGGATRIGGNIQDTTNGPWNGSLDELAVFDYALSASQIFAIFDADAFTGEDDEDTDRRRRR